MYKITLKIDGMMCGMCEAHINDAIRKALPVSKVKSSHSKGRTELISEEDISETELRSVIEKTGYMLLTVDKEPYEKKGLFRR